MEYVETSNGRLPKVGLGTFSIPIEKLKDLILESLNLGYSLFDTAYKYKNEAAIAGILKDSEYDRSQYIVETKVCAEQLLGNLRYLRLNRMSLRSSWKKACGKIRTDKLDVFLLHSPFVNYERFFSELMGLKSEGLIGMGGICNITIDQLVKLKSDTGKSPDIVQVEVHPYFQNQDLVSYCKINNIIVEARSPFAHGDAIESWNRESVLLDLSKKYNKTVPQIILRWITQQDIIVLPKTSSVEHLKENIQIFDFKLSEDEMCRISLLNKKRSYGVISCVRNRN